MKLKSVSIYNSCMTTYGSKIKARFAFFDEVFHQTSLTVKLDKVFRWWIHVGYNKSVHIDHLILRLFHFTDYAPFISLRTCLVHEFTIHYSVIHFVFFWWFHQVLLRGIQPLNEEQHFLSNGLHSWCHFLRTVYITQGLQNHCRQEATAWYQGNRLSIHQVSVEENQ